ncbi:MAG TPA: hypothetical protein VFS26_09000, partial [Solirubrobacterales bacterium]|nr:hypothetical protein [Solirubrobacterales bacterium]
LLGDGQISMLPRGVDEYLERRLPTAAPAPPQSTPPSPAPVGVPAKAKPGSAEERNARKTLARLDKQLARIAEQEAELHARLEESTSDYERLADLGAQLQALLDEKESLEMEWLEAAEILD